MSCTFDIFLQDFFKNLEFESINKQNLEDFETVGEQMMSVLAILEKDEQFHQQLSENNPYFVSIKDKLIDLSLKILNFISLKNFDLEDKKIKKAVEHLINVMLKIAFLVKSVKLHLQILLKLKNSEKLKKVNFDIPADLEDTKIAQT